MKKIKYSDFESVKDVIALLNIQYNPSKESNKQTFFDSWVNIVGKKLASVSKPIELTENNLLIISCKNSFIANELFLQKNNLLEIMSEPLQKLGLEVHDIKFDYKNWKK